MISLMEELKLPRYGLIHFYDETRQAAYSRMKGRSLRTYLVQAGA